jgi:cellulose synthase/poly-beta-1,6-N-acetylglucosamine synthase-like glycosyltransferase
MEREHMPEALPAYIMLTFSVLFLPHALSYYYLVWQSYRRPAVNACDHAVIEGELPKVTVQLPMYREKFVARRVIEACARLDYPKEKLQVMVCDDSDDETVQIVDSAAVELRSRGFRIDVIRRKSREGFKAGALREALKKTEGEFVAIFDADSVPGPDFLRRCIPHLLYNQSLAFVEARLTHLNRNTNWLSRTVALAIDGYCLVELLGRYFSGLYFNMNGTSVVIRKKALEEEPWETDTITEDLDLAYRLQTRGWIGLYLPDLCVQSEVPPSYTIFKTQQFRWSKGYFQCLRKNWRRILRDERASPFKKVMGLLHLSAYLFQPLMTLSLFVAATTSLFMISDEIVSWAPTVGASYSIIMGMVALSPALMYYAAAQKQSKLEYMRNIPALAFIALATAVSNSIAILEGVFRSGGTFVRTEKYGLVDDLESKGGSRKRFERGSTPKADLAISLLAFLFSVWVFVRSPLLGLYLFAAGASWLYSTLATKLGF